jgi:hypothetical protein
MTFSCPHFDIERDACWRLKTPCVPGRPGCVLRNNSVFAVPVEERLAGEKPKPRAVTPVKKERKVGKTRKAKEG